MVSLVIPRPVGQSFSLANESSPVVARFIPPFCKRAGFIGQNTPQPVVVRFIEQNFLFIHLQFLLSLRPRTFIKSAVEVISKKILFERVPPVPSFTEGSLSRDEAISIFERTNLCLLAI